MLSGSFFGGGLQIFHGVGKLLRAVVAEPRESARLRVGGIGRQRGPKGGRSRLEVALLELRQSEVEFGRRATWDASARALR